MNKNEYRRALIMLRGLSMGYSGHVRLERRTLMGTMQFTVNGASEGMQMSGVLLGNRGGRWYAVNLGPLITGRRDQAGLLANFDPRNIGRRDLDDYALVGVACPSQGMVLSGFLHGSCEVDWDRVKSAVATLFTPSESAPEPVTDLPQEPTWVTAQSPAHAEAIAHSEDITEEEAHQIAEEARSLTDAGCACEVTRQGADCICPQTVETTGFYAPPDEPLPEGSAIEMIPEDATWPESALAVRALFEQNPPCYPFAAHGYVFVRAPLGGMDSGEHCLIGLKAENDAIVNLCYAVPGTFSLEPPVGLEGYSWRGSGSDGYWTTCINLSTGEPVESDEP